jgi:hypothetical protein
MGQAGGLISTVTAPDQTNLEQGARGSTPRLPGAAADFEHLVTVDPELYVVGDEIARGGVGRIQLARDRRLGRRDRLGLAKDLTDPGGDPGGSAASYRSGSGDETSAGSILGTPAYMPPEQATGSAVDERADVYALGAMLYPLLAGARPYDGTGDATILETLITGPRQSINGRLAGIPLDLVAIVNKAMAHSAADRYPTAKQLADDLENAFWQQDLMIEHQRIGHALTALGDAVGSLDAYKAGLAIATRLQAEDPDNADIRAVANALTSKVTSKPTSKVTSKVARKRKR